MTDSTTSSAGPWHAWFLRSLIVILLALPLCGVSAENSGAVKTFDVPAGDAIDTLKRAAQQAEAEIMFPADTVRGVRTNAVTGNYTVRAALDLMVEGTSLIVVQDQKTGALTIARKPTAPSSRTVDGSASAAEGKSSDSPETKSEVVHLPSFSVNASSDVGYVGKEALSTTRTGIELLDLAQSVKVLNRDFINDINPSLLIDSLKYVGGGQAGNINFADDRFTLRGFNSPANNVDFVDGFKATTDSNTDLSVIDRLEIIKGPSAIFVANGPVGGVINKVTKGPVSYTIRSLKVQAGLFDANRVELDLGGRITPDGKWLYRVVAAAQYADGWYDHTYAHRFILAPSLAYVFDKDSRLTVKYHYFNYKFSSYNGLPLDERTGRVIAVPRDATLNEDDPLNWRKDIVHRVTIEYTKRFNDVLAMRLAAFNGWNEASRVESVNGISLPTTFVNGTLLSRSTTAQDNIHNRRQFQADFVSTFDTGPAAHRLLFGTEFSDAPSTAGSFTGTSSAIDPFNPIFPGTVTVGTSPSSKIRTNNKQAKVFILETASLFNNHMLLSFGASHVHARTSSTNKLTGVGTPQLELTQNLKQYSALFKVTPHVSLYYGYNENFAPNFLNGLSLPAQIGQQNEFGIKADIVEGKLAFTVAHFDIKQANIPVPSFPQTNPATFLLVPGQTSKGVDGDLTYSVNRNLDIIASFAVFDAKAKSQANSTAPVIINPVNNVAENTFGLWTRYKFTEGSLKGLAVGLGISHLSSRAIANNANSIIYGYLDGFTLADLSVTYDHGPFRYGLNVDNLLNTKYDAAVRNQSIIVPGMGTNVKASITWKF